MKHLEAQKEHVFRLKSIKRVVMNEGITGLYRGNHSFLIIVGYTVSVFVIPLFYTLYLPLYERVKNYFKDHHHWDEHGFKLYSASAGISGLFCNVVTNPFWVVRTRMQAETFRNNCNIHYKKTYLNILHSLEQVYRHVFMCSN